jgi:hypothetical protein
MAKKGKRHSDAASIVGEELANDLESKSQELVGRSDGPGIDPSAVILKDKHGFPPGEKEEEEGMATGTAKEEEAEEEEVERAYGGALTLNQAEVFLVREKGDDVLLGDWGVLAGVLTNITGDEHAPAIREELKQFQSRIDVMAVKALADLNRQEEIMPKEEVVTPVEDPTEEPQAETLETEEQPDAKTGSEGEIVEKSEQVDEHALDSAVIAVRDAFDEAVATPIDVQSRLKMIQPSLNDLGKAIMSRVDETGSEESDSLSGGVTLESIQQIVTQAVAPLVADVEAIKQRSAADANKRAIPERRAMSNFFEARSSLEASVPGATARLPEEIAAASGLNPVNPQFRGPKKLDGPENTPNLRNLIRRSVGIRE